MPYLTVNDVTIGNNTDNFLYQCKNKLSSVSTLYLLKLLCYYYWLSFLYMNKYKQTPSLKSIV